MSITPGATLTVGQTDTITPEALNASGVVDTGATITSVTYVSDNTAVATVASNSDFTGTITAVAVGTANLSATIVGTDSNGASFSVITPSYGITVTEPTATTTEGALTFGTPA
jgi:uncharacterized protein YjdB